MPFGIPLDELYDATKEITAEPPVKTIAYLFVSVNICPENVNTQGGRCRMVRPHGDM